MLVIMSMLANKRSDNVTQKMLARAQFVLRTILLNVEFYYVTSIYVSCT